MTRPWRCTFFYLLLFLSLPALLQAQRSPSGHPSGGVIDVQVRNPNGTPGPRDIHIRLESAEGGPEGDAETIDGGKCQFRPTASGVYLVRLVEPRYKEVTERVELIAAMHGFVTIVLRPAGNDSPAVTKTDVSTAPSTVTVGELRVPDSARKEYDKGQAYLRAKDLAQATEHFEKATKLFDNFPQAYRMLGETYLEQQQWDKAEQSFRKSISLDPMLPETYFELGAAYNQQKEFSKAETALKKGLELNPDAGIAKYELAKAYMGQGRWEEAEPYAKATVTDAPDLAAAHVLMGNIYLKRRDAASALHEYQAYLHLEPEGLMAPGTREMVAKLEKMLAQ